MKRRAAFPLLLALCACAAPALRLSPVFPPGQVRTYRLVATARTTATIGARHQIETTTLRARSEIAVIGAEPDGTRLRMTLTPGSLTRNGQRATAPQPQQAEFVVGSDGSIVRLVTIGGLPPALSGQDVSDLAPLLGTPLPARALHVGSAWTTHLRADAPIASPGASPPPAPDGGVARGRVAALRRVDGYDCAIIALAVQRPVTRDRVIGGQPVALAGTEFSTSETAYAFRDGFPVSIATRAQAVYGVSAASVSSGRVTIDTDTTLVLIGTGQGSSTPGPAVSPSAS